MQPSQYTAEDTPLKSAQFRKQREAAWQQLESLIDRAAKRGVKALSHQEILAFQHLYHQAVSSLSVARAISLDASLLDYLEALCARAYLQLYAPPRGIMATLARFFWIGWPQAVRKYWKEGLLAFAIDLFGAWLGFRLMMQDSSWFQSIMPASLAGGRTPEASRDELLAVIYDSGAQDQSSLAIFAAELFSHNTSVAFLIFALGPLLALPSMVLMLYNGLIMGAFLAIHASHDLTYDIVAWLSIHGVTEIWAFVLAGQGGLALAGAALFPGTLSRSASLARAGSAAVKLAMGAALMLVIAAMLEGFGRQLIQDPLWRLVIGWGFGALWAAYFLLAGREQTDVTRQAAAPHIHS